MKNKVPTFKEFVNENINEKKVFVSWDDDNNAFKFSDGETSVVDYDGEFKYKNKWFDTLSHNSGDDLIRDLEKAFPGTKFEYKD